MTVVVRLVVSLVAGWVAAGITVAILLKQFPGAQKDYLGIVAVVIGLGVAGVCWRVTRSWRPRKATSAELAQGFDVHLGKPFLVFLLFISVITLGTFALIFWLPTRRWPKKIDPEGMTLRNGSRLAWKDVTGITEGVKKIGGARAGKWWELRAGEVKADVVPNSLAEGPGVLEFLSRVLGRDFSVR